MNAPRSILLLEMGFMKPRGDKPVHGVELFRINLLKDLIDRGTRITIPAERSWAAILRQRLSARFDAIRFIPIPGTLGATATALLAALSALNDQHELLILGNPGRGMIPAMHLLHATNAAPHTIAFAHRRPKGDFLQKADAIPFNTIAVSEHVAQPWRSLNAGTVTVLYGITNADQFSPPTTTAPSPDTTTTRFVLLARLPNISKGEALSIEAFRLLPRHIRDRCELHLAAYINPPPNHEHGIIRHPWLNEGVPAFLRTMHAMLTLSSNETFSQSVVQGMLTALPIIATPLDVFTEKLGTTRGLGQCGFIAETPEQVAQAMATLATDAQLRARLGHAGRDIALQRYVWDTDRFLTLIAQPSPTLAGH